MEFDTDKKFCSIIFDVMVKKGVREVVCSPGSRNTPLLIAASARNELKKHFVLDERSASFTALGLSLVSKCPVALVCTSGTALLNYAPGIAEAYYQGIPLIVVSADRPLQWIDQDDSQTLHQNEALSNFVKKSYNLPAHGDSDPELQWFAERITHEAMAIALSGKPGPVHINIHLEEPLGNKIEKTCGSDYFSDIIVSDIIGNREIIRGLADRFVNSKVLLIAGFMQPDAGLQKTVSSLALFPNVVLMAETLSNLHLGEQDYSIDSTLTAFSSHELDNYLPDLVISLGGAIVSRKLKEFLRNGYIKGGRKYTQWNIGWNRTLVDCFKIGALQIESDPSRFLRTLIGFSKKMKIKEDCLNFKKKWQIIRSEAGEVKSKFIKMAPWSEIRAFDFILKNLPLSCNLFLSNGTPVRYAQIISHRLPHAEYCNRGVSGIDGSVSTAIGGARNYKGCTLLITGDLSLSYDIGALSQYDIPDRFKIIVIDNQGGGIFRFIPTTSSLEEREEYFCMPPNLPLKDLAAGYRFKYFEASDENSLSNILPLFFREDKKSILRIICDGVISADVLKTYMSTRINKEQLKI